MAYLTVLLSFLFLLIAQPGKATGYPADSTQLSRPTSRTLSGSELNIRLNYTSQALFSGRDFGVREWISTPSITYYAKSGFYADLSGYYLSQSKPHYEMTALSVGYLGILSNVIAYSGEFGRTVLIQRGQQNLLPYNANTSLTVNLGPIVSATSDYSLLFGNATAHRLRLSLSAYLAKAISASSLGLKRISVIPTLTAILGTEISAYNLYQPNAVTGATSTTATTRLARILQRLQAKKNATTTDTGYDGFGLMALDFSAPVRVTFSGFRIGITNHLVRPFKLYTDEDISTDMRYYADISLTWVIK
ncbi:hypothetical protein [Spirosoma gilvum]